MIGSGGCGFGGDRFSARNLGFTGLKVTWHAANNLEYCRELTVLLLGMTSLKVVDIKQVKGPAELPYMVWKGCYKKL